MSNKQRLMGGSGQSNGPIIGLLIVGAVTVAGIIGLFVLIDSDGGSNTVAPTVDESLLVTDDAWQTGDGNESVTVVEFLDLECEACRAAHPVVQQIIADYEGQINYVVRNFPNHSNSVLAAKAAEAAGEQGKYWEMFDKLFETQPEWGEREEPQAEAFISYAAELGLDLDAFTRSLNSEDYIQKIEQDREDGIAAGVNATPTFFINGERHVGVMDYQLFADRIEDAIGE